MRVHLGYRMKGRQRQSYPYVRSLLTVSVSSSSISDLPAHSDRDPLVIYSISCPCAL